MYMEVVISKSNRKDKKFKAVIDNKKLSTSGRPVIPITPSTKIMI